MTRHDIRPAIKCWFRNHWQRYIDLQTGELCCTKLAEECIIDLGLDLMYNDDELEVVFDLAVDFEQQLAPITG